MRPSVFFSDSRRKFRIAIVEDSDIYRGLLERFVNDIGNQSFAGRNPNMTIFCYKNAEELLQNLDKIKPEIVLLDYYLNGYNNPKNCMNGYEALHAIKQLSPATKVIMVSGQGDFLITSKLVDEGAEAYVSKEPGSREALQRAVYSTMRIIADDLTGHKDDKSEAA